MSNCRCRRGLRRGGPEAQESRWGLPLPQYMSVRKDAARRSRITSASERQAGAELAHSRNGTTGDLRLKPRFHYSSPATQKTFDAPCDAPTNANSVLGSSGKGIRDDRNIKIFRRKVRRRHRAWACHSGVVGLRRRRGRASSDAKSEGMTVTPSNVTMRAGETTQFTAQISGSARSTKQTFTWYVNGVAHGSAECWQHRRNR